MMLKTVISNRALIPLSLALAAGAGLLTATPAHAGERDRATSASTKAFKAQPKRASQTRSTRGVRVAAGDVNNRRASARRSARSQDGGGGIFNNGGTVSIDRARTTNRRALTKRLDQSTPVIAKAQAASTGKPFRQEPGTTVPTADDVQAPQGETEVGLLLPAVQKAREAAARPQRAKLSQNGTTVATATEVKRPETEEAAIGGDGADVLRGGAGNDTLISGRDKDPATGKPFRQEPGTTVPTADDVQAPQDETQVGLLLPAVQKAREAAANPQRTKLKQNGTTVATASEINAPSGSR